MTSLHYSIIVLGAFATCYGWKYSISLWNKCHTDSYVELFNRTLDTCMLECVLRNSCIAVQYERLKRSCGILAMLQLQEPLKACNNFIYIQRSEMNKKAESCAPYQSSTLDGSCITECAVPDNLRLHSEIKGYPSVRSRIKVICNPPYTLDGNQSIRCNEDGKFSTVPTCGISDDKNVALGKSTWQSSTFIGGKSSNSVDGNTNPNWFNGSCSHTEFDMRAWWMVDLEDVFIIKTVVVYNRQECCGDFLSKTFLTHA